MQPMLGNVSIYRAGLLFFLENVAHICTKARGDVFIFLVAAYNKITHKPIRYLNDVACASTADIYVCVQ